MPRKPTGRPRGRPEGTGHIDSPRRITVWLNGETYNRLEAYAEGRSFAHGGSPQLATCVREAIDHYLVCPQKRQTQPQAVTDTVTATAAPQKPPRQRTRQAAPAD